MTKGKLIAAGIGMAAAMANVLVLPSVPVAAQGTVARPLSPLEVLLTKEAIRDKLALYSLLFDGDGTTQDHRKWVEQIWMEDATFQAYDSEGKSLFGSPAGLVGRDAIMKMFGAALPPDLPISFRHILINTAFDEITANTAKTRTVGVVFRGPKVDKPGSPAALTPVSTTIFHDSWRKGADGEWRKSSAVVYCTMGCQMGPLPQPK